MSLSGLVVDTDPSRHAVRDARATDGPALTEMVRTCAAFDGEYRVMVARQRIDSRS